MSVGVGQAVNRLDELPNVRTGRINCLMVDFETEKFKTIGCYIGNSGFVWMKPEFEFPQFVIDLA